MNATGSPRSTSTGPRTRLSLASGLGCVIIACFFMIAFGVSQSTKGAPQPAITLDPPTGWDLQEHAFDAKGIPLPESPANFRRLGEATTGQAGAFHTLTFRFAETATLTHINLKSTRDFRIERGGSCVEGGAYAANTTCTLLVRFTPKGAGNRLGHLLVNYSASGSSGSGVQVAAFGLGGYGYSPVISFIPSVITTVPGTYPSNVGLLSGAQSLAIDGTDTLYIADTGNNNVRYMDSSGIFRSLDTTHTAPRGITVDTFAQVYFDLVGSNNIYSVYDYGPVVQLNGTGTVACTASAPCNLSSEALSSPGMMSTDGYNHLFFADSHSGMAMVTAQPTPQQLIFLYDPFPYQLSPSGAVVADRSDNLYSLWANGGTCSIVQQSLYNAEVSSVNFTKIAGGHTCGFSGDGGLAGNAEIGAKVGQFAFDTAGDLYFTDAVNQRVRRIEYTNGIIRTVAGNGTAGYTGDGGKAPSATLNNPTGIGVDSQGAVYIISSAATGQVIRKVGPQGLITFPNQGKGTASAAQPLKVTNTGNSAMVLTNVAITGANAADFKIDNTTTTCILTQGASLYAGQTCIIGTIFTPAAVGARSATLTLLDNTINGADKVTLSGTGTLPSPIFTITSPANGASFTSGTAVSFSVKVTSASGPQPTGTVQFKVDGANYGSAVTLSSTGTASTSVTGLTTTSHTLSVTYSGDANYAKAGPISVTITVTTIATVKFTSPLTGQAITSTTTVPVAVTVSASNGPTPTGTVKFRVDGNLVASATLVSGKASGNVGVLSAGTHILAAAYSGDKYHPSSQAKETITVSP